MKTKKVKLFLTIPFFTFVLAACSAGGTGSDPTPTVTLDKVTGINYSEGILSFNKVEGAASYEFTLKHLDEVVYQDSITGNAIDVSSLDVGGTLVFDVYAVAGNNKSEVASYTFVVTKYFDEVIIEAENNLYNFGTGKTQSNFRNNPLAHNGAYVGGLDDAGHGVFINYLSPEDGTFELESYYCYHPTVSGITQAHHDVVVNGDIQNKSRLDYTVDTGWGGATFSPVSTSTEITLRKGWNTIAVFKNGDSSDNWGDFAEIDYFKIIGSGEEYNPDDLDIYGSRPNAFRLEAEMGSPRKKGSSGMTECKNPCIADSNCSNGFIMGGIESKYDGVEWHFDSPVKATYEISLCYAAGSFSGSQQARPTFIVTQSPVAPNHNVDFNDEENYTTRVQMDALEYNNWNQPEVAEQKVTLELNQGDNFIYCLLMDGSGFFQIDYCDLAFVSTME